MVPTGRHVGNDGQERVSRRVYTVYRCHHVEGRVYLQVVAEVMAEGRNEGYRRVDGKRDTVECNHGYAK